MIVITGTHCIKGVVLNNAETHLRYICAIIVFFLTITIFTFWNDLFQLHCMTKLQCMHAIINESKIIHALSTNLMHSLAQITQGSINLNIFFYNGWYTAPLWSRWCKIFLSVNPYSTMKTFQWFWYCIWMFVVMPLHKIRRYNKYSKYIKHVTPYGARKILRSNNFSPLNIF